MKITGQDTTSSSGPAASRQPAQISSRWVVMRTVLAWGLLILVLALGIWAQARSGAVTSGARRTVGARSLISDPRLQLESALQRAKLPTLYLNIEFKDVQRLQADRQGIELTGVHIPTTNDVVTATVRLGDDVIPVQIQLPAGVFERGSCRRPGGQSPSPHHWEWECERQSTLCPGDPPAVAACL